MTEIDQDTPTCTHVPTCPSAEAPDRDAAHAVASHPDQGWTLLCNGVIVFEDTGELLPDGRTIEPHRGPAPHVAGLDRRVLQTIARLGEARDELVEASRSVELALAERPTATGAERVVTTWTGWLRRLLS